MGIRLNPTPTTISLPEGKRRKIKEIQDAALRAGQTGTDINVEGQTYHMAVTPDDVALLQQANQVAKMLPVDSEYRTAEIKEKWPDGRTFLHTEVPEAVHDAVLFQAALYAREILLKQEILIQAVQEPDIETLEDLEKISWAEKEGGS